MARITMQYPSFNQRTGPSFLADHRGHDELLIPGGARLDVTNLSGSTVAGAPSFLSQVAAAAVKDLYTDVNGRIRIPAGTLVSRPAAGRTAYNVPTPVKAVLTFPKGANKVGDTGAYAADSDVEVDLQALTIATVVTTGSPTLVPLSPQILSLTPGFLAGLSGGAVGDSISVYYPSGPSTNRVISSTTAKIKTLPNPPISPPRFSNVGNVSYTTGFRLFCDADAFNGGDVHLIANDVVDAVSNPNIELLRHTTLIYENWLPFWPVLNQGQTLPSSSGSPPVNPITNLSGSPAAGLTTLQSATASPIWGDTTKSVTATDAATALAAATILRQKYQCIIGREIA